MNGELLKKKEAHLPVAFCLNSDVNVWDGQGKIPREVKELGVFKSQNTSAEKQEEKGLAGEQNGVGEGLRVSPAWVRFI